MPSARFIPVLALLGAFTLSGCAAARNVGYGAMAAARSPLALPAALFAGLAIGAAQQSFRLDPEAAQEAEERWPRAQAEAEGRNPAFPPP